MRFVLTCLHSFFSIMTESQRKTLVNALHDEAFQLSTSCFEFSGYKVGDTLQAKLQVRNISALSRQLRILPPSSPAFAVKLGKLPHASSSSVAPGMSVTYTVQSPWRERTLVPHSPLPNRHDSYFSLRWGGNGLGSTDLLHPRHDCGYG